MMSRTDRVVYCHGLRKSYGRDHNRVDALLNVDLSANAGDCLGILGPNGAGKTTLIEILEGFRSPDSGVAEVFGVETSDRIRLKKNGYRIGISPQHSVLPPLLTIEEVISQQAAMFPNPMSPEYLIGELGLYEKKDSRIDKLSGGQQQRVTVALALVGNPELIFLDEPTSQLDPHARRAVWSLLERQRRGRNATIILTTHQMEEAQQFCDRVVIIDKGKVLADDTPSQLVDKFCPERIIEFRTATESKVSEILPSESSIIYQENEMVRVLVPGKLAHRTVLELIRTEEDKDVIIDDIKMDRQSLEDVFIRLTGRGIRG